jgi:Tfp pilus assembly pilus retraction ATPase PilT
MSSNDFELVDATIPSKGTTTTPYNKIVDLFVQSGKKSVEVKYAGCKYNTLAQQLRKVIAKRNIKTIAVNVRTINDQPVVYLVRNEK